MNVLIVSYHFYPFNTPRAFRTHELVKEFVKQGHSVDLVLPNKTEFQENPVTLPGLHTDYLGGAQLYKKNLVARSVTKNNFLRNWIRTAYGYFNPYKETKGYISEVYNALKDRDKHYDIIMSIAHPFAVHVGVAKAIHANPKLKACSRKIAEYSDPFTLQSYTPMFRGYRLVDKWIARTFDYLSIPTRKAVETYTKIKPADKIRVIPQGFNFDEIVLKEYRKNDIPTFAYAGTFYTKIRNPRFFFDFLVSLDKPFRFILFTSKSNTDTRDILEVYQPKLKDKLTVIYNTPRLELISQLSTMDFLISIDNTTENQVPSKLIDYALSGRPAYSFSEKSFSPEAFDQFLAGNYSHKVEIDLEAFNIKNIVRDLISI